MNVPHHACRKLRQVFIILCETEEEQKPENNRSGTPDKKRVLAYHADFQVQKQLFRRR